MARVFLSYSPRDEGRGYLVEELIASLVEEIVRIAGWPEDDALGLAYLFAEVLDGRNARVESGISDVLGREARDFKDFARNALAQPAHHG